MSEHDPVPPPDPQLQAYIDAFAEVERPSRQSRDQTWAAIESRTQPRPWLPYFVAGAVAAAAVLALFLGLDSGWLSPSGDESEPSLAPYEQETGDAAPGERSGEAVVHRPARQPDPTSEAPEPQLELQQPAEPEAVETTGAKPRPRRPASAPAPTAPARSALAEETALFKKIQLSLSHGNAAGALRNVQEHRKRFPNGTFRLERQVAEARALCKLGRRADARRVADAFVAGHPRSALATQMKKICAEPKSVTDSN